jgi:hypothetical protein
MSIYVDPENQKLLWNIINTNPYLTNIFAKYHPSQKTNWFKSIIEHFYKQNQDKPINELDLHQMNKDTLAYMIQLTQQIPPLGENHLESANMSPFIQPSSPPPPPLPQQYPQIPSPPPPQYQHQQQQPQNIYNPVLSSQQQSQQYNLQQPPYQNQQPQQQQQQQQQYYNPQPVNQHTQSTQQQYYNQPPLQQQTSQEQYYNPQPKQQQSYQPYQPAYQEYKKSEIQQQEYKPIFDRKKPEPIDFSEKIEDGVITNMDDLIQKHMREREQELKLVTATTQQMIQPITPPIEATPPKIEESVIVRENIKMVETIPSEEREKINTGMENLKEQMMEMKDIILLLKEEVKGLREKMEETLQPS